MRHHPSVRQRIALGGALGMIVALGALALAVPPAAADVYMPLLLRAREKPFDPPPTAPPPLPSVTPIPTQPGADTPTPRAPTRTPRPTATDAPTATPGASPTPTLSGEQVDYPTDPDSIVIQIGWIYDDQYSSVWEEMNGTPWFTLYGDGRLIASKALPNREQDLLVGQVDEYVIQKWLRALAYDAQFFSLEDRYAHPRYTKPELLIYAHLTDGYKRLRLQGCLDFEKRPPAESPTMPTARITMVLQIVRDMEKYVAANLTEPFVVEQYTVLAQEMLGGLIPTFPLPKWTHGLNIKGMADAAPTAASNYDQHVPGHKFVNRAMGEELRAIVLPEADKTWVLYNRAAAFTLGGRYYSVGVRQEVPGGSQFLPDVERAYWYRRDSVPVTPTGGPRLTLIAPWAPSVPLLDRLSRIAWAGRSGDPPRAVMDRHRWPPGPPS